MPDLALPDTQNQAMLKRLFRAFFSPPPYEIKPSEQAVLARGHDERIRFDGEELAVTSWGEAGPRVLLLHGWAGSRAQMTGFVDPLLAAGYRLVAFDQPGQGQSGGGETNLLRIAPSMDLMAEREGPFHAILAHSFGTLLASYAIVHRNFPPPARLVYFGSFNRLMDSLPRFQAQVGLPDAAVDGLRHMIYERFGRELIDSIANESFVPYIQIPALMFHDKRDEVTPVEDSRAIAHIWKTATLIETEGLGHRRALQSKEIHDQVVNFLKS